MIRHLILSTVAIAAWGMLSAGSLWAEAKPGPGETPKKAVPKSSAPAKPDTKAEKPADAAVPPDLKGVWKGRILGHGGGRGGGGRGRGPGGGGPGGGGRQMEIELTIDAKTIKTRDNGRGAGAGTYTVTGNGTGNLDAEGTEGRYDGRDYVGIYELKGDELKWSVANGHNRPKGFTPQGGSYVMILKRQKN